MANERLSSALESICSSGSTKVAFVSSPRVSKHLKKRVDKQIQSNKTYQFFRSISKRRLRSSSVENLYKVSGGFRPFDRGLLLDRISSFQSRVSWNISSESLTPLSLSLAGWSCDARKQNTITCGCCNASVLIKLPEAEVTGDDETDLVSIRMVDKIAEKYVAKAQEFHRENCPWRKQLTPFSVYEISFGNMTRELESFHERYRHNLNFAVDIEAMEFHPVLTGEEYQYVESYLKQHHLDVNKEVILVTLLGWTVERKGSSSLLLLTSRSDARRVIVTDSAVDLVAEHHKWSCFVQGYRVLLQIFKSIAARDVESPSTDDGVELFNGVTSRESNTGAKLDKLRKVYFE